jgi:hypothetical protein
MYVSYSVADRAIRLMRYDHSFHYKQSQAVDAPLRCVPATHSAQSPNDKQSDGLVSGSVIAASVLRYLNAAV